MQFQATVQPCIPQLLKPYLITITTRTAQCLVLPQPPSGLIPSSLSGKYHPPVLCRKEEAEALEGEQGVAQAFVAEED